MNELPNETWISAYLDDELAADERTAFERWLVDNPAAGQLLNELRSAGETLRSLPREQLGPEFAARVLRQAERTVLLPMAAPNLAGENGELPPPTARSESPARINWTRWSRPLLWSAAAMAAAVLIAVFSPTTPESSVVATRSLHDETRTLAEQEPPATGDERTTWEARTAGPDHLAKDGAPAREDRYANDSTAKTSDFSGISRNSRGLPAAKQGATPGNRGFMETQPGTAPLDGCLLVLCEVTPRAAETKLFSQVLANNRVSSENLAEPPSPAAATASDARRGAKLAANSASAAPQQSVFLVEASPEQLANVLAELQQNSGDVLTLNVDPAPQVPDQQVYFNYSRALPAAAESPVAEPEANSQQAPPMDAVAEQARTKSKSSAGLDVRSPPAQSPPSAAPEAAAAASKPVPVEGLADQAADVGQQTAQLGEKSGLFLGRLDFQLPSFQNQIRQQIPVDKQQFLCAELERFSNAKPTVPPTPTDESANRNVNQARAVELQLIDTPRIDLDPLTPPLAEMAKDAGAVSGEAPPYGPTTPLNQKLSGGGATPKEIPAPASTVAQPNSPRRESGQAASEPQAQVANEAMTARKLEQNSLQRKSRGMLGQQSNADGEPLVKAVFVIQARDPAAVGDAVSVREPAAAGAAPASDSPR